MIKVNRLLVITMFSFIACTGTDIGSPAYKVTLKIASYDAQGEISNLKMCLGSWRIKAKSETTNAILENDPDNIEFGFSDLTDIPESGVNLGEFTVPSLDGMEISRIELDIVPCNPNGISISFDESGAGAITVTSVETMRLTFAFAGGGQLDEEISGKTITADITQYVNQFPNVGFGGSVQNAITGIQGTASF